MDESTCAEKLKNIELRDKCKDAIQQIKVIIRTLEKAKKSNLDAKQQLQNGGFASDHQACDGGRIEELNNRIDNAIHDGNSIKNKLNKLVEDYNNKIYLKGQ